jgi:hypothetical protein
MNSRRRVVDDNEVAFLKWYVLSIGTNLICVLLRFSNEDDVWFSNTFTFMLLLFVLGNILCIECIFFNDTLTPQFKLTCGESI